MNFRAYVIDARNTIMANKLRSSLSSLWIIIWVSSVVILLSIGAGTKEQLTQNMWSMTTNSVTISASNNASAGAKELPLTNEVVSFLQDTFSELSWSIAALKLASNQTLTYWTEVKSSTVNGISSNYFSLSKQAIKYGTGFTETDYTTKTRVAILNYSSLDSLFDNQNPVWQSIKIKGKRFTIIWILDQTSIESMGRWGSSITAYVPFPTFQEEISVTKEYDSLVVYLPNDSDNATWKQIIHYALLKRLWLSNVDQAAFSVNSFASFVETLQSTITMFTYFLWVIGGISLLVWGIWVMNIMIVSVTERTREIGIRKAIGALKRDIIMQFLTESVVITFLWGFIAIVFSYAVVYGINFLISTMASSSGSSGPFSIHLSITSNVVILAFTLTALTGIWFGILPAQKAVQLKTIDALRFE